MPRFQITAASPADHRSDLSVVFAHEGPEAGEGLDLVSAALDADLIGVLKDSRFKGKVGELFALPTLGRLPATTVLVVGLGKAASLKPDSVRRAAGKVAGRAARHERIAIAAPDGEEAVQALVEGLLLGSYRFDRYRENGEGPRWKTVALLTGKGADRRSISRAVERGEILAEATAWARDLVNAPAADAPPAVVAEEARRMARKYGLECKVWTKAQLEKGGFGGILGVGRGSHNDPRLIELRYKGGSGKPIALTGKGVTFDSGGLSIKDSKGMEAMKSDMAGAASVMATMQAIARLKPKINVIAAIPSAENMPGGGALHPGDVLHHRGGKTSEVLNTDAEGRLILADALAYLAEQKPELIVDTATLTGACMVALGEELWGIMANDRSLAKELLDVGEEVGEPGWELPLWEGYEKQIESSVADVKNIGNRWGGAITAGLFLKHFVADVPWAHMDIAGVAFADRPGDYWSKGATGSPVRTLVRFVEGRAKGRGTPARAGTSSKPKRQPSRAGR